MYSGFFFFFLNDHVPVLSFQVCPCFTEKWRMDVWNLQGKIQNSLNLLIFLKIFLFTVALLHMGYFLSLAGLKFPYG